MTPFCLQSGLALSVRNLGTMGVILYGTTLVSRMGAATLAAHEIMRQVFIFSIQLFSALDVTAQSMVGLQLGKVRLQGPTLMAMCILNVLLVILHALPAPQCGASIRPASEHGSAI